MTELSDFQQDWVSPPGQTLLELLELRGMSEIDLADMLGIRSEDAESLIVGNYEINEHIAKSLSQHFGASQDFWIAREKQYRALTVRGMSSAPSELPEREWLRCLPVADMMKYGWIPQSRTVQEKAAACLAFFGVSSIKEWHEVHRASLAVAAFRTTASFDTNNVSVSAWLRMGEIEAEQIECEKWNPAKLKEMIPALRRLTWNKEPKLFLPKLRELCSSCGIALVIARAPKGCRASGATRFIGDSKALILLSFRYLSDDQFWFTFFHEVGHLLLHGKNALFLEDGSDVTDEEEMEANQFSGDALIPPPLRRELLAMRIDKASVLQFSKKAGIAPGIVIGQLQHMNVIGRDKMNYFKRRYTWDEISPSSSEVDVS